jgi:O-antigen ligase
MLTGGITLFMSILFIFSFFILKFFVEERNLVRRLSLALVIVMMSAMFAFSHIYKRLDSQDYRVTDYWERAVLWEAAIQANSDVIFGVGTGDYKTVMNKFYNDHQMPNYADESYNSHNQFIQMFLSNGAIGLVSVIFLIGRPLFTSVRNQNVLGALIFFPFLIYGMTEVFLGRFQGLVFFVLLHQTFMTFYSQSLSNDKVV